MEERLMKKLRIDRFSTFKQINLPKEYDFNLDDSKDPEVILYYIQSEEDVTKLIESNLKLPKENRVIIIFEKGKRLRDKLLPLMDNGFKMKAPMLCSISDKLSGFCLMKV